MIAARTRSRLAIGRWTLAIALLLMLAAHVLHPSTGLPVYDGFITEDPYRYLDPPPGQLGAPTSFSGVVTVNAKGKLPDLIATTDEAPPQAQIFAPRGTFVAPAGAQRFLVSITPVEAPTPAPKGSHLVGNTYAFVFTTDDGRPVRRSPGKEASVVLRGVVGDGPTTIYQYTGSAWQALKSQTAGGTLRFANIATFGDFVLIAKGPAPSPSPLASGSPGLESSPAPTPSFAPGPTPTPTPGPTPVPSPTIAPTSSPQPSPSEAPVLVPAGSGPGGAPIIVVGVLAAAALGSAALGLLIWRRRGSRKQDWRPYR